MSISPKKKSHMNRSLKEPHTGLRKEPHMKRISKSVTAFSLIFFILANMALTACAAPTFYDSEKTDVKAVSPAEGSKGEAIADAGAVSAYEDFIKGKRTVVYHSADVDIANFLPPEVFKDGESYSLDDLIEVFQKEADKVNAENSQGSGRASIKQVEYSILDEGQNPVLALHIVGENFLISESTEMWYLIHYDRAQDQLNVAFGKDSWSRSRVQLNQSGVVICDGSGGAFDHGSEYYKVDDNGEIFRIYSAAFSNFKAANDPDLSDWDKGYTLASYYLNTEEFNPDGYSNPADYYTIIHNNEADDTFRIGSNTSIDKDNPAYRLYAEDNITIVGRDVVVKAILERMSEKNIHLESLYADKPVWKKCE